MKFRRGHSVLASSLLAAGLLSAACFTQSAMAEDAPAAVAAPEPGPFTANVTLTNDYRYRGISQSGLNPAIQGGFDYAHPSGFYIGNWNSSISWISDSASAYPGSSVSAPIEMDFYAGYKHDWSEGFIADLGVLQYFYPTSGLPGGFTNPNTKELYVAQNFTVDKLTGFVKFSVAVTNLFGFNSSSGSNYTDLTLNYDTGVWGLALNGHVGYQYVAGTAFSGGPSNSSLYSYTDWKLGVTKDFGSGFSGSLAYVATNANNYAYVNPNGTNLGRAGVLVSVTKTF